MNSFDTTLFHSINNLAGQKHWLDLLFIFGAKYLVFVMAALFICLAIKKYPLKEILILLFGSSAIFSAIGWTIGHLYLRPRPFVYEHVNQLLLHAPDASFPSDHTGLAFILVFLSYFLKLGRRATLSLLGLGLFVGFSRIAAGLHWPSDILGGIAIAFVSVYVIQYYSRGLLNLFKRIK